MDVFHRRYSFEKSAYSSIQAEAVAGAGVDTSDVFVTGSTVAGEARVALVMPLPFVSFVLLLFTALVMVSLFDTG